MNLEDFKQFVINYKTFNWESRDYGESDFRDTMKFKHSFLMSFIRFYKVNKYLENLIDEKNISNSKIVDVGAYPGNMAVLSKKIFKDISEYCAIGLDLDKEFIEKMREHGVKCINTEIDPNFPEPKEKVEWNIKNFDICYLLDTIEHLVDPTFCLDKINMSMKNNGYLLITTDNITNFLYIADMIRKGKSLNVPPLLSSMVYRGDHRPHHREYSKEELIFTLKRSGFEVVKHEFFDRKQGDFYIDEEKKTIKKHKVKKKIKNIVYELIKNAGFLIPHFRNHHIILAKKTKNISDDIEERKVTYTIKDWLELRKNTIGY